MTLIVGGPMAGKDIALQGGAQEFVCKEFMDDTSTLTADPMEPSSECVTYKVHRYTRRLWVCGGYDINYLAPDGWDDLTAFEEILNGYRSFTNCKPTKTGDV